MSNQPTTFILTDAELVELCTDPAWAILRFDRTPQGYRVEAVKVEAGAPTPAPTPTRREPYRDD